MAEPDWGALAQAITQAMVESRASPELVEALGGLMGPDGVSLHASIATPYFTFRGGDLLAQGYLTARCGPPPRCPSHHLRDPSLAHSPRNPCLATAVSRRRACP